MLQNPHWLTHSHWTFQIIHSEALVHQLTLESLRPLSSVSSEKSALSAKASWMPIFRRMVPRSYVEEMENFGTNKSIHLWGEEVGTHVYQHTKLMIPFLSLLTWYYIELWPSPRYWQPLLCKLIHGTKNTEVILEGIYFGSANIGLQH